MVDIAGLGPMTLAWALLLWHFSIEEVEYPAGFCIRLRAAGRDQWSLVLYWRLFAAVAAVQ